MTLRRIYSSAPPILRHFGAFTMAIHRATLGFFRRVGIQFSAAVSAATASRRHSTAAAIASSIESFNRQSGSVSSAWTKPRWDLLLGISLSAQTAIVLGLSGSCAFADETNAAEAVTNDDQREAYVTGLRRIEDGSVISNSHTSKWRIFTDTGRDLFQKGKLDEAEKFFQSALYEAIEGFGPRDPHVASSYNNLAEFYRVRKEFEKAEPLYLEAIKILEESFGPDDIRVGAALHNVGQFYLSQQKLDHARIFYERALKIKGRILGHGHLDYANTMYHLGTVLHLQRNDKDAEALISESIRILEEGGQGETLTCVRRMKYLSQILLNSNRLVDAEKLQRKILHIFELSKGWDSLDTIMAAEALALTLQSLGSLTEASELLERCLDSRKKILPEQHIQVAVTMLHLARVTLLNSNILRKGDISGARDQLNKAKLLADDSIRIAKENLDVQRKSQNNHQNKTGPPNNVKDGHAALSILLQSLDFIGLLEVTLNEEKEALAFPSESKLALHECISLFNEPDTRGLLNSPEVKRQFLACLKHLSSIVRENTGGDPEKLKELQELKEEVQRIESELLPPNRSRRK